MARRRRKLNGLGAVEGEKVEYFLPAAIFNATTKDARKTIAYCMRDVEAGMLQHLDYQARVAARKAEQAQHRAEIHRKWDEESRQIALTLAERGQSMPMAAPTGKSALLAEKQAKVKAKAGNIFAQTADEVRKDVAEIRSQGVTGPIPACVYRSSGKWGDRLKTAEARANRSHERFHADVSREEYTAGRKPYECDDGMATVLGMDPELVEFSRRHWSFNRKTAAEEVLARVEEVAKECYLGGGDGCGEVVGRINDWFVTKGKPELAKRFADAAQDVRDRFKSSAIEVVKKACKVPR